MPNASAAGRTQEGKTESGKKALEREWESQLVLEVGIGGRGRLHRQRGSGGLETEQTRRFSPGMLCTVCFILLLTPLNKVITFILINFA